MMQVFPYRASCYFLSSLRWEVCDKVRAGERGMLNSCCVSALHHLHSLTFRCSIPWLATCLGFALVTPWFYSPWKIWIRVLGPLLVSLALVSWTTVCLNKSSTCLLTQQCLYVLKCSNREKIMQGINNYKEITVLNMSLLLNLYHWRHLKKLYRLIRL